MNDNDKKDYVYLTSQVFTIPDNKINQLGNLPIWIEIHNAENYIGYNCKIDIKIYKEQK